MHYTIKKAVGGQTKLFNMDWDVIATFAHYADFLCWKDGARERAVRLGKDFSVFDEDADQFIAGTLGQLMGD